MVNSIQDNDIDINDWWELLHQGVGDSNFYLTGSPGDYVWNNLRVNPTANQTILNIGVGFGYDTKELVDRGCHVHVLDISKAALEKVYDITEGQWLHSELPNLPQNTFDLILSHLVAQHMNNEDLSYQLKYTIPALKSTGIFAIQFSFNLTNPNESRNVNLETQKDGRMCRSKEFFINMVNENNGEVVWIENIGEYPDYNMGWYAAHIKKR